MFITAIIILLMFSLLANIFLIVVFLIKKKKSSDLEINHKNIKRRLRELQFFNQKVLDHVPVSLAVIDRQGNVLLTNKFFRDLVPWYKPEDGLNIIKSKRINDAGLADKYANVLKTGISFSQKGVMINAPKPYRPFYMNFDVFPLKDEMGEIIGAISIGQEITSLIKAKDNLTKINVELDYEVKKRTKEFYEINRHLAEKIDFYEKILDFISEKIKQTILRMDDNDGSLIRMPENQRHEKFTRIFKDFIILNEIEKKQISLNFEKIVLVDFLQNIIEPIKQKVSFKNSAGAPLVMIDKEKLSHVLMGLYYRFYRAIDSIDIELNRRGNHIVLNLNFILSDYADLNNDNLNFFWDVQLFMYKEIINLHKGILFEQIDNHKVNFNIKLLLADQGSL